jgi:ketosteroid isomerase-like protein
MTLNEIAAELIAGCREGRETENLDRLYAPDAVSVEAMAMEPGGSAETRGLAAIKEKHAWWNAMFEFLGGDIAGPFPHGDDRFAVVFSMTARNRETGEESAMQEVAVYHVRDGRIVREEFFYSA